MSGLKETPKGNYIAVFVVGCLVPEDPKDTHHALGTSMFGDTRVPWNTRDRLRRTRPSRCQSCSWIGFLPGHSAIQRFKHVQHVVVVDEIDMKQNLNRRGQGGSGCCGTGLVWL